MEGKINEKIYAFQKQSYHQKKMTNVLLHPIHPNSDKTNKDQNMLLKSGRHYDSNLKEKEHRGLEHVNSNPRCLYFKKCNDCLKYRDQLRSQYTPSKPS